MSFRQGEIEVVGESEEMARQSRQSSAPSIVGRSLWSIAWRRLRKDKVAMTSLVVIVVLILIAIFADQLAALYGHKWTTIPPITAGLLDPATNLPKGALGGISGSYWLGVTPVLGQDLVSQLMEGARVSLIISGLATALSLLLGVSLGLIAGFYRGWIDTIISRVMDVLLSFPTLLLSLSLIAVISILTSAVVVRFAIIIFVLGFFGWPYIGRIVRGQVLSLREKEFVDAARSLGANNRWIMVKEIMPNLIGPILVYTSLTIPNYILGEAGLSYLGVGVPAPIPSWGQLLSDAGNYFQVDPMYLVIPGLAIFITVLAFNLFGDGLRDALDPKSTK